MPLDHDWAVDSSSALAPCRATSWAVSQQTIGQLDNVSIRQSVELVVQASRGAEALHQAGLVHRDIKPGNIFVSEATVDSKPTAKLGDFGLVQILDSDTVTLTRAAETTGTPAYMSPEQSDFVTEVDSRSDAI